MRTRLPIFVVISFAVFAAPRAGRADTFGAGKNSFTIDFVTVGNPGNAADTTDFLAAVGSVPYVYRLGKYEISEQMVAKANALGGLGISIDSRGPDKPATSVSWYEAARFVNWLNTSVGTTPAYKFDESGNLQLWTAADAGYNPNNLFRNRLARYFLPSVDEWHKAAYYDPAAAVYYDYPTGSDLPPDGIDFPGDSAFDAVFYDGGNNPLPNDIADVGVLSPYGTGGQGGNVFEWEETEIDLLNDSPDDYRGLRGGTWIFDFGRFDVMHSVNRFITRPWVEEIANGFRVASIPEASSLILLTMASFSLLAIRRR